MIMSWKKIYSILIEIDFLMGCERLENKEGPKTMLMLVAEDNPSNQRVLVEMLKRLGYRADAVADVGRSSNLLNARITT
jgi:hypothetical protein